MAFISFPSGQMGGAIAVNVFAGLCTLALVSVALRAVWLALQSFVTRNSERPQEYVFFNTQLGNYAGCLLVAMFFNTLAGMMGLPWLIERGITEGTFCTVQGFLLQLSTWSSGFFTVMIAVHTFNCLVLKKRQSVILSRTAMSVGWAVSILMATIPFFLPKPDGDIYGADGFLCGVRAIYPRVQFFLHLLPILLASILSSVFYSIIYLVLRGTLSIKGGIRLTLDPHHRWTVNPSDHYHRFIARIARSMIWYPVAYVALLVPYSVMKLLVISGFAVPFEAMVFAATCWFALGVVNVLLFYNTFRILEPAFEGTSYATSRRDVESGFFDKDYSSSFQPRTTLDGSEKIPQFHLPMPAYRTMSMKSASSEERLLPSHEKSGSQGSIGGVAGYGRGVLSSPRPTLEKAEALAHSPQSSISSSGYVSPSQLFRTPLPSASVDGNIERYNASPSLNSITRNSPGLQRGGSVSSTDRWETLTPPNPSRLQTQDQYLPMASPLSAFGAPFAQQSPRSPPRQLTLSGDRRSPSPSVNISRLPSARSRNNSPPQRPLLLPNRQSNDDFSESSFAFVNPRTPPNVPSPLNSGR